MRFRSQRMSEKSWIPENNAAGDRPTISQSASDMLVNLTFSQLHGKSASSPGVDGEIISSLQFNSSGDMLAAGDLGGYISLYKRNNDKAYGKHINYDELLVFRSHEPGFDYLKSLDIEEKIIQVDWVPRVTHAEFLLSANEKTIKLWKIGEQISCESRGTSSKRKLLGPGLFLRVNREPKKCAATLRRLYPNAHSFHMNSVSVNSDQETFLSADDLRINLWNLEVTDQSFVIVDIKPENMDDVNEVITTASFHPSRCNVLMYSTSRGSTKLCDLRTSALCDKPVKIFDDSPLREQSRRGLYSEISGTIGDSKFSSDGRFLAARHYLEVKVWDTLMESKPLAVLPIQNFVEPHMDYLFENDAVFDKFSVSWNKAGTKVASGSYGNFFCVGEPSSSKTVLLEAQAPHDATSISKSFPLTPKKIVNKRDGMQSRAGLEEVLIDHDDFSTKTQFTSWHPKENVLAVAESNKLYLFQDKSFV